MQTPQNELRQSMWSWIKSQWNPKPIDPPTVDPGIAELDSLQRSAEAIRYSILSIEFWISPNGQVREWLKHNSHMAVWLAIPAFLILPIITFVLVQVGGWIATLVGIAGHLIIFPILALLAGVVFMIAIRIAKSLLGIK